MGTSYRSQHGQSEKQPSPHLGSDVDLKSCLLSFQVFEEVLFKLPTSVHGGRALREPCSPTMGLLEELGLFARGAKKELLDHLR